MEVKDHIHLGPSNDVEVHQVIMVWNQVVETPLLEPARIRRYSDALDSQCLCVHLNVGHSGNHEWGSNNDGKLVRPCIRVSVNVWTSDMA